MAVITQYLIKNGAVQDTTNYPFAATTTTTGTIEGVNISFTMRGFDANSVSSNYRRLRENVTSYANREGAYYLTKNISFSGWSKLRCTFYATHNATDGTGRYCRVYIYKNTAAYLDSGTKGTNYQYVQAGTSSSTKDISLTSTLISNCNRIAICVATSYADVSGYIKDLWLERDANEYSVKYYANGHGTAPDQQTKIEGTTLQLQPFINDVTTGGTSTTVTITGNATANGGTWSGSNGSAKYNTLKHVYSQTYWNTNSGGTGTNYGSGANYTSNAALNLYAIWKDTQTAATGTSYTLPTGTPAKASSSANSYTVAYNANGHGTAPATQTSTKTTSYSFKGWYTAASGGTQRTTSSRVTAAETVYAQFNSSTTQNSVNLASAITASDTTETGYLVTFNANSGTTTKSSENATRTIGWTFSKWAEGSASGTQRNAGASFTPSANTTMYAIWTSAVVSEGSVTLPTAAQCTRAGYELLGFSTSDTATTATYLPGATYTPTGAITLYAVWLISKTVWPKVYVSGTWKDAVPYVYVNGSWKEAPAW